MTTKDQTRAELQAQMDDFLARGGKITVCPTKMPSGSDGREFTHSKQSFKDSRVAR